MLINSSEMPVPRLELNWVESDNNPLERTCWYKMVLPLRDIDKRLDYHEGADKETKTLHIRICHTIDRIGSHVDLDARGLIFPKGDGGTILLPYSDKMHAVWDAGVLNLPMYVSYKEHAQLIASPGQVIHSPHIAMSGDMGLSHHYKQN